MAVFIYMAIGAGCCGVIFTFILLLVSQYFGIVMLDHLWMLALPVTFSVLLNILFVELYYRHKKRWPNR